MSEIDPIELRRALGAFMTGVTVVTTIDSQGAPTGFTANSFTSVSLDEPLVLFCLACKSMNREIYLNAGKFAINILAEDQQQISWTFASPKVEDRFSGVGWNSAETGSPILDGSAAWFDCVLHETVEAGDHVIVIGRVLAFDSSSANPLGFWKGNYVSALLEHKATDAGSASGLVGVVLEYDGKILLVESEDDKTFRLPRGTHIGSPQIPDSLLGVLAGYGVQAEIGFVFSVIENNSGNDDNVLIYYRGTTESNASSSPLVRWFSFADIPWESLANNQTAAMLKRYIDVSIGGRYSVYVGDSDHGKVHSLADKSAKDY
ncbi:MAG: flavin reductase family protein [Pseudomonadota bacterium]